jgi:hypothetical protein
MARPATRSRTTLWLVSALAGSGLFASVLHRSITRATGAAASGGAPAGAAQPSEGERWAQAQRDTFAELLRGFASDVSADRVDEARGRLGGVLREALPRIWLAPSAKAWLTGASGARVHQVTIRGGTARAMGLFLGGGGRGDVEAAADFTREQGAWRLTGLLLGGQPAFLNQ